MTRQHERDKTFVPPRPGVRFFTWAPEHRRNAVTLPPKATHALRIALLPYFDLPAGSAVTVWVSYLLPGVHRIPTLAGGSGILVAAH